MSLKNFFDFNFQTLKQFLTTDLKIEEKKTSMRAKQLWQAVSQCPRPPIMVPLPSHSLKQWGQLGEILGGVRFPECGANRSAYLTAHGSGSSVE